LTILGALWGKKAVHINIEYYYLFEGFGEPFFT
jgi:hypothetical protein